MCGLKIFLSIHKPDPVNGETKKEAQTESCNTILSTTEGIFQSISNTGFIPANQQQGVYFKQSATGVVFLLVSNSNCNNLVIILQQYLAF